jgi:hypothetical protein
MTTFSPEPLMTSAAQALPAVLERIDADLDRQRL